VTLDIDDTGNVSSSTGFPAPVPGRIYTEAGYVAGYLKFGGFAMPETEITFDDVAMNGSSAMSGTFGVDCTYECSGGSFRLAWCSIASAEDTTPDYPLVSLQNFPNPFNPSTTIAFEMAAETVVDLLIYDVSGRLVRTILTGDRVPRGRTEVVWDGRDSRGRQVSSGGYFYRLSMDRYTKTQRMMLVQ
jgi:hypothetical protein